MDLVVVIPARQASTRIKSKPYLKVGGRYLIDILIDHVRCALGDVTIILTSEDERVIQRFDRDDVLTVRTSPGLHSGTERAAEAVRGLYPQKVLVLPCDVYFNDHSLLSSYVTSCSTRGYACATLVKDLTENAQLKDPAAVKMLTDRRGKAYFFARVIDGSLSDYSEGISQQLGVYFYAGHVLRDFLLATPATVERLTNNESFRFLLEGVDMYRVFANQEVYSLNTEKDLYELERAINQEVTVGE